MENICQPAPLTMTHLWRNARSDWIKLWMLPTIQFSVSAWQFNTLYLQTHAQIVNFVSRTTRRMHSVLMLKYVNVQVRQTWPNSAARRERVSWYLRATFQHTMLCNYLIRKTAAPNVTARCNLRRLCLLSQGISNIEHVEVDGLFRARGQHIKVNLWCVKSNAMEQVRFSFGCLTSSKKCARAGQAPPEHVSCLLHKLKDASMSWKW